MLIHNMYDMFFILYSGRTHSQINDLYYIKATSGRTHRHISDLYYIYMSVVFDSLGRSLV